MKLKEKQKSKIGREDIASAVVRFCGDSGDGMQLAGGQFSNTTSLLGNDLMTFPDFPAEIRAPRGSLAGVSGFQIHFSAEDIHTPGDKVDVLISMNPAALKTNLQDLRNGGTLIINKDSFDKRNLERAGYAASFLESEEWEKIKDNYSAFTVPITQLTLEAVKGLELQRDQTERCKNFFALGLAYWLFDRDLKYTLEWIPKKFKSKPQLIEANQKTLKAGYYFAETSELLPIQYTVQQVKLPPGLYRNINGATALVFGLLTAAQKAGLPLFYAGYPITPASDILHEIAQHRHFDVKTFQAEDEIAAACAALGASYGGHIGVTASSGPGIMLKSETINLAVMTELPLVIIDAQRAGPSTGLPTKTEQSDLLLALFGRSSESPLPIVAPATPSESFAMIIEAVRLSLHFMTPVFYLSDLYLIMGSEPWRIPNLDELQPISHNLISKEANKQDFAVYKRNPQTLARDWAIPGTTNFEHRIGGLEKDALTGNVNYDPKNHEAMVRTRAQKIANIANFIPKQEVYGDETGRLLVLGWGSTHGMIREAVIRARSENLSVSHAHLRYLCPLPQNLGEVLSRYDRIFLPEINLGQLAFYLKASLGIEVESLSKVTGRPFLVSELYEKIKAMS